MSPRLTIVLPLKGRHLFTLRFLWHANKVRIPYKVLIADGQVHPELARLLEDSRNTFAALDLEYLRYPEDSDFTRFFAKMANALQRVSTPYVMIVDNDDFLACTGVERSLEFLEKHPDYVCCDGGVAGFAVYSHKNDKTGGLVGPLNGISYRYARYDRSIDVCSASMMERLITGLRISWSYYAVFRTSALLTIWREVREMNFSDLQLHERYCVMRTLTLGKARSDPATIAYLRQYWTSSQSAFAKDWVHHLVRSRFSVDFANIISRISGLISAADGLHREEVAERLCDALEPWFADFLRRNYGPFAVARKHARRVAPGLVRWLKMRRRLLVSLQQRAVLSEMKKNDATPDYIKAFEGELAQITDVINGKDFGEFIQPYLAKFAAA